MPHIALTTPVISMTLTESLAARRSKSGRKNHTLTSDDIGALLGPSLSIREDGHRPYPSGGGLYPVETYLLGSLQGFEEPSVFHYDPKAHALDYLWNFPKPMTMDDGFSSPFAPTPRLEIVFTAVWQRASKKYNDFSYILALIESGHMAQNVLLAATTLDIYACPTQRFHEKTVHALLDLDPEDELVLYAITLG